ncbi:dUTP diphosphatase [Vagococcus coleopterorum]|uniref:dUTP diphosphatase n=1 Tax=Vagococcus coleopterorum TaxID=2714946 RepID=A0A6G8AM92_9ENTE|nr:dUTP diphosphatase [Vagococcus coleopterorum]QIL46117.1 dUTP diphosphatase [Vagococcus coleopterorum]
MTKTRGFERLSTSSQDINLPVRATKAAAGYDFEASADTVVPSIWKQGVAKVLKAVLTGGIAELDDATMKELKPVLVPTEIKAYMGEDEFLQLCNRSSNPLKNYLLMANGVGIIDSDYYNNENNEGHIMFQLLNFGLKDKTIVKGERIGQGIFMPFLKADQDDVTKERTGGFGSSGK